MRHLKAGKRLGVTTSHRKAMMRNLVTSLFEHGQIQTTITRAKEMRKEVDKMIGYGKKGDLHSRRLALKFVKSKDAMAKLFDEYGPLYKDRNGGYTRILKLGNRLGDNALLALIQLVDVQNEGTNKEAKTTEESEVSTIKEVKEELVSEAAPIEAEETDVPSSSAENSEKAETEKKE